MNIQSIGESAGIVWKVLHGDNRKWEYQELKQVTGLRDRELNSAIGWLAREGKIQFDESLNKDKQSLEEFYKLKYCSTVVYMVPRA